VKHKNNLSAIWCRTGKLFLTQAILWLGFSHHNPPS